MVRKRMGRHRGCVRKGQVPSFVSHSQCVPKKRLALSDFCASQSCFTERGKLHPQIFCLCRLILMAVIEFQMATHSAQ